MNVIKKRRLKAFIYEAAKNKGLDVTDFFNEVVKDFPVNGPRFFKQIIKKIKTQNN